MKRFYPDFDTINAFTLSLDYHQGELECVHCLKNDQFVSHGIIYKQRSGSLAEKVGKRIFCSNRYGRNGCGRTFQLYVANEIPSFRYGAAHLFIFIAALIANQTVSEAYIKATGQTEYRNAWRWLSRLMLKLSEYRSFLKVRCDADFTPPRLMPSSLKHLLPTLDRLFTSNHNGCFDFQIAQQQPFI
ncbi:hypothetical protein MNBD_GAMMA10-1251 [hydrothermal vent metagenome]|uniref:Uncharacterized protein n=1 Tax=hydrothermal vent metagenome TaxID=652676 RepID=A0A3B0Y1B7_9ZZZZ